GFRGARRVLPRTTLAGFFRSSALSAGLRQQSDGLGEIPDHLAALVEQPRRYARDLASLDRNRPFGQRQAELRRAFGSFRRLSADLGFQHPGLPSPFGEKPGERRGIAMSRQNSLGPG